MNTTERSGSASVPSGGGWFYERAKIRCHAALEANGDLAFSRQAFIAASIECD